MTAGRELDRAIRAGLPPGVELDERETELLRQACRQADVIELLDADVSRRGLLVGERQRLNPCVSEARQARATLARLLGGIDLPGSKSLVELRATKAASRRWMSAS